MAEVSQTVVQLGYVPVNRGEYISSHETRYYKDNVVQYNGSSYIADPVGYDPRFNPLAYVTSAPYNSTPSSLNPGWRVFASGNNTFTTGQSVDSLAIDSTPTDESPNLVTSGGVAGAIEEAANTKVDKEEGKELIPSQYIQEVENPEYVRVYTDSEDKVLFGVQSDGNFYFGAGVPNQVKSYIEEKISALSLDEYESIVAFLDGLIGSDTTLKMMLDSLEENKVDKEEGKSLIDSEHADAASHTDNPEYLQVTTDSEDKVLEGIQHDGTKVIGGDINVGGSTNINGDIRVLGNMELSGVSYKVVESPEYLAAWVDAEDKVIFGLKADGKTYVGDADFLTEIKNNNEAIENITNIIGNWPIEYLSGKKISILGDSISTFNQEGYMIPGYEMWYPHEGDRSSDVTSVTDTWWMQVINSIDGILEINASYSGSTASNRYIGFSPRVPLLGNPDIIYIALGTNDSENAVPIGDINFNTESYDLSQFAPAYIKGIKDTIAAYPKAKIICVAFDMGIDYQNAIKTIAEHYGAEYIYVGDITDVHPNKTEMAAAANRIIESVKFTITDAFYSIHRTIDDIGKYVENPEYIEAKTDSESKLLAGRTPDGVAFENVGFSTPKVSIDGHIIKNIEDPEGRSEIITDFESKIISYRDADGIKHEEVGIDTDNITVNHLNLASIGLSDLAKDLQSVGVGTMNWSDAKKLHIEEPYCAKVNFSGIEDIPQTKFLDVHGYMEFWDMQGNYFKKEVIMNAQGSSSMAHPKKNIAIDICNNNGWDDGDTFSLQIGNWVPQDSFHLKAFYNDPFRCISPVAYKLYDEILKTRGEWNDYVWKRALVDLDSITATSTGCASAEEAIDGWDTNARCFPMGFPCIVYLNGEFYGIYSWQLKKHRDNYQMSKKKTKHIHLDGNINTDTILNANGDSAQIMWTTSHPEGFEIRNPKPKKKDGWELTMMNGNKYDADDNGGELIDEISEYWDANNASHVKSREVKQYILNLSKVLPALSAAYSTYEASSKTPEDIAAFKAVFETYFDVDNLIDYQIFSDVLANYDGFWHNVQWITYDGVKWYLCAYDLDGTMGNWWELIDKIVAPRSTHYSDLQFAYLPLFYNTELETRYKELRDNNILSTEHISGLVEYWLKRIGSKETFDKEWEKWPGYIKNDNIHRLYKWLEVSFENMDTLYNYNQN